MQWVRVAAPAIVGVVLAVLLALVFSAADPLNLSLPLYTIPLILGALFSGFALVGWRLAARAQEEQAARLAEQAEQATQDRRRFLQRLDHEFKNPLMAIRAGVTNFDTATSEDERKAAVATVTNQTMRMVRLTTDLRKIADLETRELESAEFNPTDLLTEVDELIREKAGDKRNIIFSIPRAPWPLPTIVGDWDLLFLAVYNLADNALKFSQQGDTLEIRAREEEAQIVIEVADTGRGIPEAEIPFVWDELYRGENGRSVAGSGLGLPLVKAIIERHNGTITLTSRSGQGTNVTVQLPKPLA